MLKVLIVDDEAPARRELRAQLKQYDFVQVVGEAAGAEEALELIRALPYDVVFLDIEMPGLDGMALARQLGAGGPKVVFTTAYPQYAVDAFEVGAAGYLLKPFDEERLGQVLARLTGQSQEPSGSPEKEKGRAVSVSAATTPAPAPSGTQKLPPRIPVEKGNKTLLVGPAEIAFAYALDEQVYIKLHNERLPCRFTLRELQARLEPYGFLRTHRRYLVNLEKVREVIPYFKGSLTLVVADAERSEVPVSRALTPQVRQRLGLKTT